MTHQEAVDKAARLLRLAKSDNPHEAASAAAKAQAIIDKYRLESIALEEEQGEQAKAPDEPIKDLGAAPLEEGLQLERWRIDLASTVARANGCKIYLSQKFETVKDGSFVVQTGRRLRGIAIIGRPSDAETVRYLYAWLSKEVGRLAERDGAGLGKSWRSNFRLGVVDTIRAAFHAQRKATVEAERDAARQQTAVPQERALARVESAIVRLEERGQGVERWAKVNLKLRSARTGSGGSYDPSARDAGREAGKEINLGGGRGALGAGRKALP